MTENIETDKENQSQGSSKIRGKYNILTDKERNNILRAVCNGMIYRDASKIFNVPVATIGTIYRRYTLNGSISLKKKGGSLPVKIKEEEQNFMKTFVKNNNSTTLKQISNELRLNKDIKVSDQAVYYHLKKMRIPWKTPNKIYAKTNVQTTKCSRMEYCRKLISISNEARHVVYFGEFEVPRASMEQGKQLNKIVPIRNSTNLTVMACICSQGLLYYSAGYYTGKRISLRTFMENMMDQFDDQHIYRACVIVENARFDNCAEIRAALERRGHELILMPLSCFKFNPIENLFSQWQNAIKLSKPKFDSDLIAAINRFYELFTIEQLDNYFDRAVNNINRFLAGTAFNVL